MTRALVNAGPLDSNNVGRYVSALTGLRAMAAYLVFLHHYNPATSGTIARRLFDQGYVGVSIFFVLSGFLIYHRYAESFFTQKNWSWRRYLQNRFARIFPLYALLFFLTAGISAMRGQPMSLSLFVLNITLLKGFFDEIKFSGIAQSWSLTVEACFYLLAPFLFTGLRRWGAFWLTIGLLSIGLSAWLIAKETNGWGFFGNLPFMLFYTFFGRAFEFIVGMWLAHRWHRKQMPAYRFATSSGLVILGICVIWQANVASYTVESVALIGSEFIAYNCVLPIGIGLIFLGLLNKKSIIHYVLSFPLFQALGHSSYAFYLIHLGVVANGLQQMGIRNYWLLFGLLIVIAHGLYVFIERPLYPCLSGRRLLR
ncbi:acyltransferase family protein [Spirosoma validum]|uniref:Acyltransferase n=1 Tax=Spirosoma validum TaxID=2771355 RepID=A0A927GFM0_9BACT|nr:acyltransferase [Spirosoma validum]MBD2756067.1 acyltransferase [Spirosoma validum]